MQRSWHMASAKVKRGMLVADDGVWAGVGGLSRATEEESNGALPKGGGGGVAWV